MNVPERQTTRRAFGFSLVEILTATVLLGILAFIAIPNIVQMKEDGELQLAISRAEAVNMAMASFIQAQGRSAAATTWANAADEAARYDLIKPYLAFAPDTFAAYPPGGYTITLPTTIQTLSKVTLTDSTSTAINY